MAVQELSGFVVREPRAERAWEALRRAVAGVRAFFAPVPQIDARVEGMTNGAGIKRGYDYWLDALSPADHPR